MRRLEDTSRSRHALSQLCACCCICSGVPAHAVIAGLIVTPHRNTLHNTPRALPEAAAQAAFGHAAATHTGQTTMLDAEAYPFIAAGRGLGGCVEVMTVVWAHTVLPVFKD